MNKITKTLIISLIITGFFCFDSAGAFSLDLSFLKKDKSTKTEKLIQDNTKAVSVQNTNNTEKTDSKIKKIIQPKKQNISEKNTKKAEKKIETSSQKTTLKQRLALAKKDNTKNNTQSVQNNKSIKPAVQTEKTTKPDKVQKNKKLKKEKKTENTKNVEEPKKEKYDDAVVTAKTHFSRPSVRIIIKSDKKGKAQENKDKEKKVSQKKDSKKKSFFNKKNKKNNTPVQEPKEREVILKQPPEKTDAKTPEADVFSSTAAVEGGVSTTKIVSVDDCVKIALENNPAILSQLISKDIYKNQIAQAWSNYFPTINAQASYSRNDMMVTNFRFPTQKYNMWNMPSLGVNVLLYDFGKTSSQAGIAKKTYEASRETLQSSINDVVYQVKTAYYNQLFLQQQVQVYEDSVLQYQIHLEQAKAYYAIGSKAKIDVSTAELNLDNTKLTLVQAKNSVETGFAQLTNAMGVPEFAKFEIQDNLDRKKYNISFNESIKIACDQNPTLLAAKKKMEGSKLLVKSAKVAFLPDISGFGSYSRGGGEPSRDYGYQIGAQIGYSNLNLLLLKQQVDQATLTYKKDQADYETQRQKLYLDVKQAYIQLKNAQESIPVARASMNVAKERYDLAAGRYKAGLGDAIEIKDAQITYQNAKLQFYNTLMQYHISAANLERVIGAPLIATDEAL